jgi:HK97 family phage portal protein
VIESWRRFGAATRAFLTTLFDGGHPRDPAIARLFGVGNGTAAGIDVTVNTAMTLSAVFAAVNFWGETVGSLPLHVYRKTGDDGREIAAEHPANWLLHTEPNAGYTAKVFRRQLEIYRLLWGNAYAWVHWDARGAAGWLELIEPWRVQVFRNPSEQMLRYRLDGNFDVPGSDMLHIPGIGFDGLSGQSVISYAREQMGAAIAMQNHAAKFFGNGAQPSGLLEHPGVLKPEARAQLRADWEAVHGGASGSNKVAVLWEGMSYKPISIPNEDAQFLESRQFEVTEIARWFNLPPHVLRDLTRSTNNNIEHQGIELVVYSLLPVLVTYEQEFDRKLLAPPKLFSKHNVNGLLRGDANSRANYYASLLNAGIVTINEVRRWEELNPVPDGDTHFVPLNMVPLEIAVEGPEEPEPTETPTAPEDDSEDDSEDETMAAIRGKQLALLRKEFSRLLALEANMLRKAAATPSRFLAAVDELHAKQAERLNDALLPIFDVLAVVDKFDAEQRCRRVVHQHLTTAREAVLQASEVPPERLGEAIHQLTAAWEQRAADLTA